jgi:hypothetical protein
MRKLLVALFALTASVSAFSQTTTQSDTKKKKYDIVSRAGDHFMIQFAQNMWMGTPDSIDSHIKGLNRSANVYLMLNKPFKGDPRFSVGLGIGIGTSAIYFKNMNVNIASTATKLPFVATDSGNHYKKYKLSTSYLEVPVEFRFTANPENPNKSVKAAIGLKVGTLLKGATKGKELQNKAGTAISNSIDKVSSKTYFNSTRLAATARIGYGVFSLFGSYGLTPVFKDGVAEDIKVLQVGLTISGL